MRAAGRKLTPQGFSDFLIQAATWRVGIMALNILMGNFTCEVKLQRVGLIGFVREEKDGVTHVNAKDYELAYEAVLNF